MPQADAELSKRWDGPSDEKALAHLRKRYDLTNKHCWMPRPGIKPTPEDLDAAMFLIQEWDYGPILDDQSDFQGDAY